MRLVKPGGAAGQGSAGEAEARGGQGRSRTRLRRKSVEWSLQAYQQPAPYPAWRGIFRTFQNIPQDFAIVPASILGAAEVITRSDDLSVECATNLRNRSWSRAREEKISADPPVSSVSASVSKNTSETIEQEKRT